MDIRLRTSEDKYPIRLSDIKCQKLIIHNDVIKVMEETRNLSYQDGLEHGFFLLYGDDCRIFPTQMGKGLYNELSCPQTIPEGYVIFGFFHTHTFTQDLLEEDKDFRKISLEHDMYIMPSPDDVIIAINDYLDEKNFNHSALIILSSIDNKGLILIPRRNLPDTIYKNILNILIRNGEDRNLALFLLI